MTNLLKLMLSTLVLSTSVCFASNDDTLVRSIQDQWADIKYNQDTKWHAQAFHTLAEQARKIAESHPTRAEPLIWEGIVLSSEAGAKGGLGALSLAKEAKLRFDQSVQLDQQALDGSAYTSLGTLYAKVPGWPIGFGDRDKAEELFKKALTVNPRGIDANYFYAEFLADKGKTADAMKHLEAVFNAPPRAGRELADKGRRLDADSLKKKISP
jgi:tetratricopeptide (TPR) repeat protein